jgi:multidrug efflux system membrane fusion protein
MSGKGRTAMVAGAAALALAAAIAAYFSIDGRAREARKPPAAPPVAVSVAPVIRETMPVRIQAIGNVEAFSTVAVKARVDGQIVAVNFKEGQEVRKGEVLFRLDARPFEAALKQAEANALRDVASRDQARSQERRYKDLLEKNFISKEAYAQIRTNAETAEATAKASEAGLESARLNLAYCTIASPIDGYVGRVLLQVGNLVKANDVNPLVVINQVRPIFVTFSVPEQNLPAIREYQARGPLHVSVAAPGGGQTLAEGVLVFIDNAVDPTTGTIKLRARFANADAGLWPGQFVNLSVRLYDDPDALVIPSAAVLTGPEGQYVYVIRPDRTAEMRTIQVARTEDDRAVVARGLARGERVVTRGTLRLSPGTRVQILEAKAAP